MLTRLRLSNFQAWRDLDMPLGPFTVIMGPSGSGKTSIFRALMALLQPPTGLSFARHGSKSVEIHLNFDGTTVSWLKARDTNRFTFDGKFYDKPGRSVPEDITKALGIVTKNIDEVQVRPQVGMQFDSPFLIHEPSTRFARVFSYLSGLDTITTVVRMMKADDRQLSAMEAQLEQAKIELQTPPRDKLEEALTQAKSLREKALRLTSLEERVGSLKSLGYVKCPRAHLSSIPLSEYEFVSERLTSLIESPRKPRDAVPSIQISELASVEGTILDLVGLQASIYFSKQKIEDLKRQKQALEEERFALTGGVCPMCGGILK